jgi:hypothetical protein
MSAGDGKDAGGKMSARLCVTRTGLRGSAISDGSFSASPSSSRWVEEHHATIRGDTSAIESADDFLAPNGWETKRREAIVRHGGCGWRRLCEQVGLDTQTLNTINALYDIHQRICAMR